MQNSNELTELFHYLQVLIQSNDRNAIEISDVLIDLMNKKHHEVRGLSDPGQIGITLHLLITNKLATKPDVVASLIFPAFWCLWKSKKYNADNHFVNISLTHFFTSNMQLIKSMYGLGQKNMSHLFIDESDMKTKQIVLDEQLSNLTLCEHKDYEHYGNVIFNFLDSRVFQ
jgi:hypothetical protein